VNAYSAPDGNLYVVDMYRGVVQAGGLWTDYLTQYIKEHDLQLPVARGRIWRVVYGTGANRRGPKPALSSASPSQLVQTLAHPNGWWRDTAQQLLVQRGDASVVPALEQLASGAPDWRAKLHALWTLDGLNALRSPEVQRRFTDASAEVRANAIRLSERWVGSDAALASAMLTLASDRNWNVRRQVAASLGELPGASKVSAAGAMLAREGSDPVIVDAVISGLKDQESEVLDLVLQAGSAAVPPADAVAMLAAAITKRGDTGAVQRIVDAAADDAKPMWARVAMLRGLDAGLPVLGTAAGRGGRGGGAGGLPGLSTPGGRVAVSAGRGVTLAREPASLVALAASAQPDLAQLARNVITKLIWPGKPGPSAPPPTPLTPDEQTRFDAGKVVFANLCAGCHQADGQGKDRVAPSLLDSKYVQGNPQVLARILVGGKEGPIGLMPPLAGTLSDAQIAAVLTYIRREWGHTASPVAEIDVRELRQSTSLRKTPWTETELSAMLSGGRGRGGGN
jgi:mono/diheme cytochrome c family protein